MANDEPTGVGETGNEPLRGYDILAQARQVAHDAQREQAVTPKLNMASPLTDAEMRRRLDFRWRCFNFTLRPYASWDTAEERGLAIAGALRLLNLMTALWETLETRLRNGDFRITPEDVANAEEDMASPMWALLDLDAPARALALYKPLVAVLPQDWQRALDSFDVRHSESLLTSVNLLMQQEQARLEREGTGDVDDQPPAPPTPPAPPAPDPKGF